MLLITSLISSLALHAWWTTKDSNKSDSLSAWRMFLRTIHMETNDVQVLRSVHGRRLGTYDARAWLDSSGGGVWWRRWRVVVEGWRRARVRGDRGVEPDVVDNNANRPRSYPIWAVGTKCQDSAPRPAPHAHEPTVTESTAQLGPHVVFLSYFAAACGPPAQILQVES